MSDENNEKDDLEGTSEVLNDQNPPMAGPLRPQPVAIRRQNRLSNIPSIYGEAYHGILHLSEAEEILRDSEDGSYLNRLSTSEFHILSIKLEQEIFHYKIQNCDDLYWINENKRYSTVEKMVQEKLENLINNNNNETNPTKTMAEKNETVTEAEKIFPKQLHHFYSYQFKVPKSCEFCRNLVWGPLQKRLKCLNCGLSVHCSCSKKFVHDCRPSFKYVKKIFGIDLTLLCMLQNVEIPNIVTKCIQEIERRGLQEIGIYRQCGDTENLKNKLDSGIDVNFSDVEDIHSICCLLKAYFQSLPDYLIPYETFQIILKEFEMDPLKSEEQKIDICRNEILKLDFCRRRTLACLLRHFHVVTQFSAVNKMNAKNLAIVTIPSLLQPLSKFDYPKPLDIQILGFLISTQNSIFN